MAVWPGRFYHELMQMNAFPPNVTALQQLADRLQTVQHRACQLGERVVHPMNVPAYSCEVLLL